MLTKLYQTAITNIILNHNIHIILFNKVYDQTVQGTAMAVYRCYLEILQLQNKFSFFREQRRSGKTVTVSGISIGGPGSPNQKPVKTTQITTTVHNMRPLTALYAAESKL